LSAIQDQYETLRYPHFVQPLADTARLAAIASILGMHPARPDSAQGVRVLDIGCGTGSHLLALAARSPQGRFVGIDFSGPDIAAAQALAAEAGLTNVHFEQADLMAWVPPAERFDYVIAYGFFSWVPNEVKVRLLQVVAAALAPQGVACISYMTYPGCKQQDALRDLLRLRTADATTPVEQVAVAHATLDFLDRAWQRTPEQPHAGFLRDVAGRIRRKAPNSLLLDDLGVERDPCYVLQFAGWAAEHGLRYLGDSEFHTMLLENLPPDSARELAALALDRLHTEQMIDYISNRAFRCTLLVGPEATVAPGMVAAALRGLAFGPLLFPAKVAKTDAKAGPKTDAKTDAMTDAKAGGITEAIFEDASGAATTLRSVPLLAFVRALAAHPGALTPYARVLAEAQALAGATFTAAQEAQLCEDLLALYGHRQLLLSALAFNPPTVIAEKPRLTPFNAAHAKQRAMLVTAALDGIQLSPAEQALCALLDGSHTRADIDARAAASGTSPSFVAVLHQAGCLMADV
jgi:SAM-dependent methyltransferase